MRLSSRPRAPSRGHPPTVPAGTVGRRAAWVLLALVVVLWGINWPAMKLGLEDMGPLTFAATRMVLGAACFLAFAAMRGRLALPSRADLPIVVSVGLLQMGVFLLLVNLGLRHVPAGRSSILAYTTSLWVVPGAMLVLGETLRGRRLAGFALGILGVAVLFNPAAFDWTDPGVVLGNGLLMLAALAWAVQIIHVRGHRWRASPLDLAPWQFLVAAALLVPLALVFEHGGEIRWTGRLLAILAYNGPVATALCFWAIVTVNRALPAITTSLATLGVPVAGMASSALWLGEEMTVTDLSGLGLIVLGLAFIALGEGGRQEADAPDPVPPDGDGDGTARSR